MYFKIHSHSGIANNLMASLNMTSENFNRKQIHFYEILPFLNLKGHSTSHISIRIFTSEKFSHFGKICRCL